MRTALASLLLLAACGDDGGKATDASVQHDAHVVDSQVADAAVDAGDPRRGPRTISLTGPANSLFWDDAGATLYFTDSNTHSMMKFTDGNDVQTVGVLPVGTVGVSLGDIIKQGGGTLLVTNFGFDTEGSIYALPMTGAATIFTGLDPARKRIGLSKDSGGVVYDGYFKGNSTTAVGGVSKVTFSMGAATETDLVDQTAGLKKVVGVVATPTAVFVSDQTQKLIFKIDIANGNAVTAITPAPLTGADLMIMMPNGDLLTSGKPAGGGSDVIRVPQATGTATEVFGGFEQVHGLAYDPTLKRLFIIDHSATAGVSDKLHIMPLDN